MSLSAGVRAVGAEVALGWRRAVRGALFPALLLVSAAGLVLMPGLHDEGLVKTGYGLVLVWAFLLVCALWSGGTAYALDRERHRTALFFTKPQRRATLWAGRFLGTLAPFAAAVAALWVFLAFRPLPEGRVVQAPRLPDIHRLAKAELLRLRLAGRVPEGVSEARLLRAVRDDLLSRYTELGAHAKRRYRFDGLPRDFQGKAEATFRLSGAPFLGAKEALALEVEVGCNGRSAVLRPALLRDSGFSVAVPPELLQPGVPLDVSLRRVDGSEAASVLYRERADLTLLLPGQSPCANLTAFCLFVLLTLALAVAFGCALGSTFSLPVTLFAGTLALMAFSIATLAPEATVMDGAVNVWTRLSVWLSDAIAAPFRVFVELNPLWRLTEGEALSVGGVLWLFVKLGIPWCALCALLAQLTPVRDQDL